MRPEDERGRGELGSRRSVLTVGQSELRLDAHTKSVPTMKGIHCDVKLL